MPSLTCTLVILLFTVIKRLEPLRPIQLAHLLRPLLLPIVYPLLLPLNEHFYKITKDASSAVYPLRNTCLMTALRASLIKARTSR
jgi:hypothetical protein